MRRPSPQGNSKRFLLFEKAMRLQAQRQFDAALHCYNELIAIAPGHADSLFMRAQIHFEKKQYGNAISDLERARKARPDNPQLRYFLALNLYMLKRPFEALRILKRALKLDPEFAIARLLMARILAETGRIEDGRRCIDGGPVNLKTSLEKLTHFNVLLSLGCFDDAEDIVKTLIAEGKRLPECLYELTRLPGTRWESEHREMIAGLLASGNRLSEGDRIALHFASGRIADYERRYDQAFEHFRAGNDLQAVAFDMHLYRMTIDRLRSVFDKRFFDDRPDYGIPDPRPVFIVGMPRSGKSLVEGALAQHSQVCGIGELPLHQIIEGGYFVELDGRLPNAFVEKVDGLTPDKSKYLAQRYIDEINKYSNNEDIIINTFPQNFQNIGFIRLLFPNSKIIHILRDSLDNCLNCYMKFFSSEHHYANQLESLGEYYTAYTMIMDHWKSVLPGAIYTIRYEDLVTDPDSEIGKLSAHLGIGPHEKGIASKYRTGPGSYEAGRESGVLSADFIGYSRHYYRHLQPLIEALGRVSSDRS